MTLITSLFSAFGLIVFIFGIQSIFFMPLSMIYEYWKKRFLSKLDLAYKPFVSIIIPAYNEENSLAMSIESVLISDYPTYEIIVVNDGSTDGTEDEVKPYMSKEKVRYLKKPNGGKASALNYGIKEARGEIIFFTDADSFFQADTLSKMIRWFANPKVDAVSGNDAPRNPSTPLQKLLTITTHIGSGFVRRALSLMGTLVVISGNIGAVRKKVLDKINGFSEVWGEDLDLTFKLHKEKAKIIFDPEAIVTCHVPGGIGMLWKQRVRWLRSFIKISALHKSLFFNPRYAPFSFYLPVNYINLVIIPLLIIFAFVFLLIISINGNYEISGVVNVLANLGYIVFFTISAFSILLDRSPRDLRYLPLYGWLIIPISYFYNVVAIYSIWKEIIGAKEVWHKIERPVIENSFSLFRRKRTFVFTMILFSVVSITLILSQVIGERHLLHSNTLVSISQISSYTLATHFDAWSDPYDAITSVMENKTAPYLTQVGVGAGRFEWNFFKWESHESTWSNSQKNASDDLLMEATDDFHSEGKKVVAIIDMYAPALIKNNPGFAAYDANGKPSNEQVCFTELVSGEYGRMMLEMISYIARNYPVEAISLTELAYYRYCYDEKCLDSFRQFSNRSDWPGSFLGSSINRDADEVQEWRSLLLSGWLKKVADVVHNYGKKLYVDVPVHYSKIEDQAKESGLYYPYVLEYADGIIVWDYFYLDDRSPETCFDIAKFFTVNFGSDKVIISHGLWGSDKPVSAAELSDAILYSIEGGAKNLWITPNHLFTEEHSTSMLMSLNLTQ